MNILDALDWIGVIRSLCKMNTTKRLFNQLLIAVFLITYVVGGQGGLLTQTAGTRNQAYLDPALFESREALKSIIVTADRSQTAAQAVERLGGRVTSNLWLINGVAATLPTDQIRELVSDPKVKAVVANKGLRTAGDTNWEGYATNKRIIRDP